VPLHLPYAEAVGKFDELVPVVDAVRLMKHTWSEVEALAEKNAPLAFMQYWTADIHRSSCQVFGEPGACGGAGVVELGAVSVKVAAWDQ
jgi:hypothetical protein